MQKRDHLLNLRLWCGFVFMTIWIQHFLSNEPDKDQFWAPWNITLWSWSLKSEGTLLVFVFRWFPLSKPSVGRLRFYFSLALSESEERFAMCFWCFWLVLIVCICFLVVLPCESQGTIWLFWFYWEWTTENKNHKYRLVAYDFCVAPS